MSNEISNREFRLMIVKDFKGRPVGRSVVICSFRAFAVPFEILHHQLEKDGCGVGVNDDGKAQTSANGI